MNKYFKLKKKKKKNYFGGFFLFLMILSVMGAFWFLSYFNRVLGPGLITCAEDEVESLSVLVMNNGVRKYLSNHEVGDVLEVIRKENGGIELIRYDTKKLNQVMVDLTDVLTRDFNAMVRGDFSKLDLPETGISSSYSRKMKEGILFSVSMGSATGNSLLANVGPRIPLNLSIIQDVFMDVESKIKNYGVNNAMVEVYVYVKVQFVIQMPFLSKKVAVVKRIPLTMEIVSGEVPSYYLGSSGEKSTFRE